MKQNNSIQAKLTRFSIFAFCLPVSLFVIPFSVLANELTDNEKQMGLAIDASIQKAGASYSSGDFEASGESINEAIRRVEYAAENGSVHLYDELVPYMARIEGAHALLESKSVSLAPFQRPTRPGLTSALKTDLAKFDRQTASEAIDQVLAKSWKAEGIQGSPLVSDEVFVRRIYLDVIGRIPTATELEAFLQDERSDRRSHLIDQLLDSPGHVSHMYNWLGDMLRVKDDYYRVGKTYTFHTWLKDQLEQNRPWDEMVHEMMTAEGRLGENGATAYLLRDANMPLDSLSNTLSTFLGANVSCAQCHDHPFAAWTQRDFYQMAAFFGATAFDSVDTRKPAKILADKRYSKANLVTLLQPNMERVIFDKSRATVFPEDYVYSDAAPGETVVPRFIEWSESTKTKVKTSNRRNLREQFADWMASPQNPRFAAAISNRLWKKFFGLAVKEPVTDLDVLEDASNPELLKLIAQLMKDVNFDLREFQRVVLNSKAYQRQSSTTPAEGEPFHFPGPLLRRMTAEQVWDSVMLLTLGSEVDQWKTDHAPAMERLVFPFDITHDRKDIEKEREKIFSFADSILAERNISKENTSSGGRGLFMQTGESKKRQRNSDWLRASELPQPMPPTHFLRIAGQSARDLADDGSTEGGITESLAFMNGNITDRLMSESMVLDDLQQIKKTPEKITYLYKAFFSRTPTDQEIELCMKGLKKGLEPSDIVWALLNSREFIFIQ